MNYDNLPGHLRTAGVAWVVAESVRYSETQEINARAHHWAVMRGLPIGSEDDHATAAADACAYVEAHADDVAEFLAYKKREERRSAPP